MRRRPSLFVWHSATVVLCLLTVCLENAAAVTERILHNFSAYPHGAEPMPNLVSDGGGNFYGTTYYGGAREYGTVFKLAPTAAGGWSQSVLYSFQGGNDGKYPLSGVTFDGAGNLYGTTYSGGTSGKGTVFELTPSSSGSWTESVIYAFKGGSDGQSPQFGLVTDAAGNLYGSSGPVFELNHSSSGWIFNVIHTFNGDTEGSNPTGRLVLDSAGNIYGSTQLGGSPTGLYGTVFEISQTSGGGWTEQVLYAFQGGTDGAQPMAGVILDEAGNLYGTTISGGNSACAAGCGTVFELARSGNGTWRESILHSFAGGPDGERPEGGLVLDGNGSLYGTTRYGGGAKPCSTGAGCGVVFEVSPSSSGQWRESVISSLAGNARGDFIFQATPIFDTAGNLYVTTTLGGAANVGTFCKLTLNASGHWNRTVAYTFNAGDGAGPTSLVRDTAGNLYGVTSSGGTYSYGAVFKLTPHVSGNWTRTLLYSFKGAPDGASPTGIVLDNAGNLYGTTINGGNVACGFTVGCGVVFKLTPTSNGSWMESILHTFNGSDGSEPYGGVILDSTGNLYGTTFYGGDSGLGEVFKLSAASSGGWSETVIHSFLGYPSDGDLPYGSLAIDSAGNLYGTTTGGPAYWGTVFMLTPGSNGWTESFLHSFSGPPDGAYVYAGIVFDSEGNVYGSSNEGGNTGCSTTSGCGLIYQLVTTSAGVWTENVLRSFSFSGSDGYFPFSPVAVDSTGNVYGVTMSGGSSACFSYGCGAVFELSPAAGGQWTETVLHTFAGSPTDGQGGSALILDGTGKLYGTSGGGSAGDGLVYELIL